MRKGELLGLRWADVHFEQARLQVRFGLVRDARGVWVLSEPKTRASRRTVMLSPDVLEVLREHEREERAWAGRLSPERAVFTRASGAHLDPSNVSRVFRMLMRQAGVPRLRFHDLRHTAASLLIRQGVHAKLVSDRLGHADVAFTLRVYTHLYDDQRREAALPLDQLLQVERPGEGTLGAAQGVRPESAEASTDVRKSLETLARLRETLEALERNLPALARGCAEVET